MNNGFAPSAIVRFANTIQQSEATRRRKINPADICQTVSSANQRQVSGRSPPVQREIPAYAAPFLAAFDFHHRVAYL
jgi:hypothetical protein